MLKLKGMTWDHPRGYACLEAAAKCYGSDHGVFVEWDRRSLQAFADAPIDALAREYDLIVLDHPHVGLIAESGSLIPLPMPVDSAVSSIGGSLESYVWQGQLWAYPIDAASQVAVRRPDLCEASLSCWEDVLSADRRDCRLVTPLLPVDAFDMMMTLVAGRGEEALPVSETNFVSQESGLMALHVLKALYRMGPAEAVNWNPIHVLEAMATTNDFAYCPCLFGYINYAKPGFRPHALTYCDLPVFRSAERRRGILGGAGIGVSAQSAAADAAIDFAQWVSSEPVQSTVYLENDGQPSHRLTWLKMGDDPRYSGFLSGARSTMDAAWTRPRSPWFLGFVDAVCKIMPSFFLNDRSEEAFLCDINALYRKYRVKEAA
ncbi:MAG: extracellular solute-binding protein [Pseudomonadota bacterium]